MRNDKKIKLDRINKATFIAKSKQKKKLAIGGGIEQEQIADAVPGPWGALAKINIAAGRAVRGDGTNTGRNIAGGLVDPVSNTFNAIKSGNLIEAVPVFGDLAVTKRKRKEQALTQLGQTAQTNQDLMNFKDGGRLLAKQLSAQKGGNLKAISDDAVEVDADDKTATDSVELMDAFVDDNEVIDNENRVYSDSIKYKNGGTIAKEAKRLNKMKAEDRDIRFKDSNLRIDNKLDELFNYQEMKKKNRNRANSTINEDIDSNQTEFKSGGKIHIKPENKGKFTAYKKRTGKTTEEALHSKDPHVRKMANFAKNAKKWKHEEGGFLGEGLSANIPPKYNLSDYRAGKYKGVAFTTEDYNSLSAQSLELQKQRKGLFNESPNLNSYLDKLLSKPKGPTNKPKRALGGLTDPVDAKKMQISSLDPNQPSDINTEQEFNNYYKQRALASFGQEDLNLYNENLKVSQGNADAIIALRGGLPQWSEYSKSLKPTTPKQPTTNLALLDSSMKRKTSGYQYNKGLPAKGSITKKRFAKGGPIKALGDLEGVMNSNQLTDTGNTTNTFNWQNAASSVATFAPNITNAFLQKKLRGPASPIQESGANLQRISAEPQLAQASRDFRQAQGIINKGTAQGSDLASATGSLLAKRFNANNQIYGQTNQLNAQISNQEAFLNQGVKARNTDRLNQFRGNQVDFQNKKKQLTSENVANLSEKVLARGREKNLMDRDKLALSILGKSYGDSGIYQRNLQNMLQDYMKTKGFKNKGGKINKLYKGGMC